MTAIAAATERRKITMSDNPMRILVVEPTKDPYVKEIDGSLASMQSIVGGYIQAVSPFEDPTVLLLSLIHI